MRCTASATPGLLPKVSRSPTALASTVFSVASPSLLAAANARCSSTDQAMDSAGGALLPAGAAKVRRLRVTLGEALLEPAGSDTRGWPRNSASGARTPGNANRPKNPDPARFNGASSELPVSEHAAQLARVMLAEPRAEQAHPILTRRFASGLAFIRGARQAEGDLGFRGELQQSARIGLGQCGEFGSNVGARLGLELKREIQAISEGIELEFERRCAIEQAQQRLDQRVRTEDDLRRIGEIRRAPAVRRAIGRVLMREAGAIRGPQPAQ